MQACEGEGTVEHREGGQQRCKEGQCGIHKGLGSGGVGIACAAAVQLHCSVELQRQA